MIGIQLPKKCDVQGLAAAVRATELIPIGARATSEVMRSSRNISESSTARQNLGIWIWRCRRKRLAGPDAVQRPSCRGLSRSRLPARAKESRTSVRQSCVTPGRAEGEYLMPVRRGERRSLRADRADACSAPEACARRREGRQPLRHQRHQSFITAPTRRTSFSHGRDRRSKGSKGGISCFLATWTHLA